MTEIFFILGGFLIGVSFLGGFALFSLPIGILCMVFGWMNRPKVHFVTKEIVQNQSQNQALKSKEENDAPKFMTEEESRSDLMMDRHKKRKYQLEVEQEVEYQLYEACKMFRKLVPRAHTVGIFFPGYKSNELTLKAYDSENSDLVIPNASIQAKQGIVSKLLKSEIPHLCESDLSSGTKFHYYKQDPDIKSLMGTPIYVNQRRNGAVVVDSLDSGSFGDRDLNILKNFSQLIGNLTYRTYADFEHIYQKEQYKALFEYQKLFLNKLSIQDIFKHIVQYIDKTLPHDRILICERIPGNPNKAKVNLCDGLDRDYFEGKEFEINGKALLHFCFLKNIVYTRTFTPEEIVPIVDPLESGLHPIQSLVGIPVTDDEGEVVMVIAVESSKVPKYTKHQIDLLKNIGGAAGFAYSRVKAYVEKELLASRDGLTGMLNHRTFQENLNNESLRARRMGYTIGLLMCDIDFFKKVNDTYGHPVGDIVLKQTSKILTQEIREGVDQVARYGGEEFVIALVDITEDRIFETAERIRKAIESYDFDIGAGKPPLKVTMSMGYALFPNQGDHIKEVLEKADQALYSAKHGGRNQVIGFH